MDSTMAMRLIRLIMRLVMRFSEINLLWECKGSDEGALWIFNQLPFVLPLHAPIVGE